VGIRQIGFDRVLEIDFEGTEGAFTLVAELMGKHSNLMLLDGSRRLAGAAKWIGPKLSSRPIQAGAKYVRPPFPPKPSLLEAQEGDDLTAYEGASPFLVKLAGAIGLRAIQEAASKGDYHPVLALGSGAYPISVAALGLEEHSRSSISIALEQHYDQAIPAAEAEALRTSLRGQLERVILARETAIGDLDQAIEAGEGAGKWQIMAELVLAYGSGLQEGASSLDAHDYEGNPVTIKLDPELSFKDNANRLFDKAKRAKQRLGFVREQRMRLSGDLLLIQSLVEEVENAKRLRELQGMLEQARNHRWLHKQPVPTTRKEDRPYEGHRIRELLGPAGLTVLYGENAESNDYLTLRVAKPNDWWLHVRGSVSAHVVIQSRNQPDRVPREALVFAAKVAVQNSPSKHSGYVPVDYTLKKYVRKPKGAAKGTALYTHEKTMHIDLDR
jgi:predicted ribosome quality control (RQC) complex YloA/Tae2 family protein